MSKRNSSPSARGQARRSTAADFRPSERWMEEGEERRAVVDREKLRAMRRAKNLTQESLSERGNISVRYLRSLETRDCNPSRVQMYGISRALGTTIEDLLLPPEEEDPSYPIPKPISARGLRDASSAPRPSCRPAARGGKGCRSLHMNCR